MEKEPHAHKPPVVAKLTPGGKKEAKPTKHGKVAKPHGREGQRIWENASINIAGVLILRQEPGNETAGG